MDRKRVITVIMVMVALGASLLLIYRSVRMHTGDAAVKDDKAISTSDLPGAAEAVEADRNEEDDPVFRISAEGLVGRWNMTCDATGPEPEARPQVQLPPLGGMETYLTDEAVHTGHKTRHYIYEPGDPAFYPVLDIYVSEKSGEVLQIELTYDEHSYRESTWQIHQEMCVTALKALMPEKDEQVLKKLCAEVCNLAADEIFPAEQVYQRGSVPRMLYHSGGAGMYSYFAAGSRSHFCIIPVDDQVMKQFEDGGAKIVRF